MFARKAASESSSDDEEEEGATTGYESEWKGFSTTTGADNSSSGSDSNSSASSPPAKPKRPVPIVSSDSDEESESESGVKSPTKRAPTYDYESPQKRRRLSLEREERGESQPPGSGTLSTTVLLSRLEQSSRPLSASGHGTDSGASGSGGVRYSPGWPRAVSSAAASESGRSRRNGPGNATDDDWDWGSVEAASENNENGSASDVKEVEGDWRSVEAASDDEEEVDDKSRPEIDDDDWGSVEAASDDEGNEPEERIDDENGVRVTPDQTGEIPGDGDYEAEPEDEGEDIIPPHLSSVETESGSESEDEPEHEKDVSHPPSDGSKTSQLVSKLPTPETSDHDSLPDYAAKSQFIHSASRQFKESFIPKKRPPKVTGRQRGEQINKFTSGYVDLLNNDIHQAAGRMVYNDSDRFLIKNGSHVMGSFWTIKHKNEFFNHLAILGKDRVEAIAKAVGKSVLECQAYINVLQEGRLETQEWMGTRSRDTIGLREIPAAVELSEACIKALDQQAKFVADRQRRDQEKVEKRRWGANFWLLDSKWASQIEQFYKSGDIDSILDIAPEAELLNVAKILELSERIFMNSSGKRNYRRITESDEKPSVWYTAFLDLHSLVLEFTRRLVQTTIWVAESRQRVLEHPIFSQKRIVRLDDVQAALDTLNVPANSFDFWIKVPRRAGINVQLDHKMISPDEVEKKLSYVSVKAMRRTQRDRSRFSGICTERNKAEETGDEEEEEEQREMEGEETDEDVQEESGTELSLINDDFEDQLSDQGSSISIAQPRHDERQQMMEDEENKYLEHIDRKQAIKVEKELWRIMGFGGKDESEQAEGGDDVLSEDSDYPKAPRREARREDRIRDWRAKVKYRAPWEMELLNSKRPLEDGHDDDDGDSSDYKIQSLKEAAATAKRRKIDYSSKKAPQDKETKQKQQPPPRSPRKQRNRRQSAGMPGFVSTVDVVSDTEGVVAEDVGDEDEDEDMYQEE
ncbi:hypothetical protein BDD12DRAFT_813892 [Trichophaea hybrida]|nr:hypothetical protein BDD12DRAFT_813892 [Trichophaea hybrida]